MCSVPWMQSVLLADINAKQRCILNCWIQKLYSEFILHLNSGCTLSTLWAKWWRLSRPGTVHAQPGKLEIHIAPNKKCIFPILDYKALVQWPVYIIFIFMIPTQDLFALEYFSGVGSVVKGFRLGPSVRMIFTVSSMLQLPNAEPAIDWMRWIGPGSVAGLNIGWMFKMKMQYNIYQVIFFVAHVHV